jgi:hypothetical protein
MTATECSRGTAHRFIADNRFTFTRQERGRYAIVDTDAERAAARTRPVAPVDSSGARRIANVESDTVDRILGAMTGQNEARA